MKERATLICKRGDDLLFVRKAKQRWQLPGGKVEPSETPLEAAYRELLEETSLTASGMTLLARYVSDEAEHFIFLADIGSKQSAKPLNEIDECKWMAYSDSRRRLKPDARRLLRTFMPDLKSVRS